MVFRRRILMLAIHAELLWYYMPYNLEYRRIHYFI